MANSIQLVLITDWVSMPAVW